jgi:shikimate kinase
MIGAHKVVLVGLMGSGKSSVGRPLAAAMGWPYYDNDEELAARCGADVETVADTEGLETLHGLEVRVLIDVLNRPAPLVASAAASVVTSAIARSLLQQNAYVVWLRGRLETLVARVGSGSGRPWLSGDPETRMRALAEGREPFFAEIADLTVDIDDSSVEELVGRILAELPSPGRLGAE